jgi:hypothetical protein
MPSQIAWTGTSFLKPQSGITFVLATCESLQTCLSPLGAASHFWLKLRQECETGFLSCDRFVKAVF